MSKPRGAAGGGPEEPAPTNEEIEAFLGNMSPENRRRALAPTMTPQQVENALEIAGFAPKRYNLPAPPAAPPAPPERQYNPISVPKNLPIAKPSFAPAPDEEGTPPDKKKGFLRNF